MKRTHLFLLGIGLGLAVPAASLANTAYTTKAINLRAGPSRDYELVAQAPAGVPVEVYGCVDDWTWCDISLGDDRGWAYAGNLEYPYQNRRVVILNNGPMIGFPIVPFSVGSYWDTYYRGRPWYSRRSYWNQRPAPGRSIRPQASRPQGIRSPARSPRTDVVRPPANRPQPRPQTPRTQRGRPEVARPQSQPARPAPARQPDKRPQPQRREDRKPNGN